MKRSFGSILATVLFLVPATGLPASPEAMPNPAGYAFQDETYLTLPEALEQVFGKGAAVTLAEFGLSKEQKSLLEKKLGRRLSEEGFQVRRGWRNGKFLGDAVVTEETGLFKKITFIVHIRPDGKVGQAAVMTYREPRGMEVRRSRFLKQYKGKSPEDPIALNRDIVGITGATLSARALSAGVKKILHFIVDVYRPQAGPEKAREH